MWILSYDVVEAAEGDEPARTRRGFYVEPDAILAHARYEVGLRVEPERNYKLEEAHHFEMAARLSSDSEAELWQHAMSLNVNCQELILRWKDYR